MLLQMNYVAIVSVTLNITAKVRNNMRVVFLNVVFMI